WPSAARRGSGASQRGRQLPGSRVGAPLGVFLERAPGLRTEEPPFLCGVLRRWIVGVAVLQCQSPERLGGDDVRLPAFWAWLLFPGLPGCPADRSTVGLHHPCCHGGLWPSPAAAAED
ncbi:unnamed protein product, partial [Ixodes pacificus]